MLAHQHVFNMCPLKEKVWLSNKSRRIIHVWHFSLLIINHLVHKYAINIPQGSVNLPKKWPHFIKLVVVFKKKKRRAWKEAVKTFTWHNKSCSFGLLCSFCRSHTTNSNASVWKEKKKTETDKEAVFSFFYDP